MPLPEAKDDAGTRLTEAAQALETELNRYGELASAIQRQPLQSEKGLRRAAGMLSDLQACEGRLGEQVQTLVAAITRVRDRQQEQAGTVASRAEDIRNRSQTLTDLLGRWEGVGRGAAEIGRLIEQLQGQQHEGNGHAAPAPGFDDVDGRLAALVEEAAGLVQAAEAAEFSDFGRQAESLRLQLLSARNKLRLLHNRLVDETEA